MYKEKYINFFTDYGFKKLFGEEPNKDLLIDFLNVLLKGKQAPIKKLTYLKTEHLGNTQIDRKAIFDLYCENEKGEKFIVELQKAKQNYFKDRSIYYSTFPIQEQAKKGDWNYQLKAVYTVGILDFIFDEGKDEPDKFLYEVKLMDIDKKSVFYDKLTFIYLEMPKFTKTEDELETHFDKWLYIIKNLHSFERIPAKLQEKIFNKLFKVAEIAKFSPDQVWEYESSLKYYRDMNNVIDTAKEEAREEGREEGIEVGKVEGREELVLNMFDQGMKIDDISTFTKLTKEEIKNILSKSK